MKKTTTLLVLGLLSLNALADEHYKCYSLRAGHTSNDVSMKISTSLLFNKITAVELVSKIKGNKFEETANPYTAMDASYLNLDPVAVAEAAQLNFKILRKVDAPSSSSIALSESLLRFEKSGYAHYYAYSCFWILDCHTSSDYFKCEKI
jgi:hypothetical protein